jgi:hypothetical protein
MNPTEAEVNAPLLKKARPPSDSSHALLAPLLSCMPVHDKARIHAERLAYFACGRACVYSACLQVGVGSARVHGVCARVLARRCGVPRMTTSTRATSGR